MEFDQILRNFSLYIAFPGIGHGLAQASQTVAQEFIDPGRSIVALVSGDSGLMAREQLPAPGYMLIKPGEGAVPMGAGVPLSPAVAAAMPNTWGHFAKVGNEHGFFVHDPAADFEVGTKGVSMNDDSAVHYPVSACTSLNTFIQKIHIKIDVISCCVPFKFIA